MTDADDPDEADRLNGEGEEPAAESGAGYGSHAPDPEEREEEAQPS